MTERSELKDLLEDSLNDRAFLYPEDVHLWGVVDDLLAAGYRRTRVIETAGKLHCPSCRERSDEQVAVVMNIIAQHTTTEWGVDYLDGSYDLHEDRQMAEDFAGGGTVVTRQAFAWQ